MIIKEYITHNIQLRDETINKNSHASQYLNLYYICKALCEKYTFSIWILVYGETLTSTLRRCKIVPVRYEVVGYDKTHSHFDIQNIQGTSVVFLTFEHRINNVITITVAVAKFIFPGIWCIWRGRCILITHKRNVNTSESVYFTHINNIIW